MLKKHFLLLSVLKTVVLLNVFVEKIFIWNKKSSVKFFTLHFGSIYRIHSKKICSTTSYCSSAYFTWFL